MKVSIHFMSVAYEAGFKEPAFDVPQSAPQILADFYRALSPKFPIKLSDMQAFGGNRLSDVNVRILLFSGNGQLELRLDKFSAVFHSVRTTEDVGIVRTCINICNEVLNTTLPNMIVEKTSIRIDSWLACEGAAAAAQGLLDELHPPRVHSGVKGFDDAKLRHLESAELRNDAEGWSAIFGLDESLIPQAHLYFSCSVTYTEAGRYKTLSERTEHAEGVYRNILTYYGLEAESDVEAKGKYK